MLNVAKHLYCSSNQRRLHCGRDASFCVSFALVLLILSLLNPTRVQAQRFDFATKEAVKVPIPVVAKLCRFLEKRDGAPMTLGGKYLYVAVYNVLNSSQKQFTDGIYLFVSSVHDAGQLFLNFNGEIFILRRGSVLEITTDYSNFLRMHKLSDAKQISYLSAIAAFMQYQDKAIREMTESGALEDLKSK